MKEVYFTVVSWKLVVHEEYGHTWEKNAQLGPIFWISENDPETTELRAQTPNSLARPIQIYYAQSWFRSRVRVISRHGTTLG